MEFLSPTIPFASQPLTGQSQPRSVEKRLTLPLPSRLKTVLLNLGLSLTIPTMLALPAVGAERIYLEYGPFLFSLPVEALEVYATEGRIEPELDTYADYIDQRRLEQLQDILVTPIDLTPVAVAQFLYSSQGEFILEQVSEVIQTKAGQPGFYAIRAALILAAADEEGLTLLNVLKKFPTYGVRINSSRGFELLDELSVLIEQTREAIAAVRQQSITAVSATISVDFPALPDLRQPGTVPFSQTTLTLNDRSRNRTFPVTLYLPQQPATRSPVVVISHGLGSDRTTFEYLATHLASYGFAVAVPEHPGSSAEQLEELFRGLASEVTPPRELIDRPLDIKYLLDELERSFAQQLDLQRVGIIGQSFGGYTALALAGAGLNIEQLEKDCPPIDNSLNLSLLLQCDALELPIVGYDLSDERVSAVIAINPFTSTIFGEAQLSQIQVPLMFVASSADVVAPALPEQIRPFTQLTNPEKYLVLLREGTHFSTLAESTGSIPIPSQSIGPDPSVAQEYMKALSLAFLGTYIAQESEYRPYLSAAYAQTISQNIMPLILIDSLMPGLLQPDSSDETR